MKLRQAKGPSSKKLKFDAPLAKESEASCPEAVMLCNTSLHVLNALEACLEFDIDHQHVWIVITLPPMTDPENIKPILDQAHWGRVIWIEARPQLNQGVHILKSFLHIYRYHKRWQKDLFTAKGVRQVFSPLNRMVMNRFLINWLTPRQVVWYDDGTLSYVLAQELTFTPEKKKKNGNAL